jgi:hypothetical protein
LAAFCLGLIGVYYGDMTEAVGRASYASFPLYQDVPGRSVAVLGEGTLSNGTRWGAFASRRGTARGRSENPCISVARITRVGQYTTASQCGPLAPRGRSKTPAYVSISGSRNNKPGGHFTGEGIGAMSFDPAVRRVSLIFSSGSSEMRRTALFNPKQRAKTRLVAFRYVTYGMQRDLCVASITGYSESGTVLVDAETLACPG